MTKRQEEHLKVFHDRSELVYESGNSMVFQEGKLSKEAQQRLKLLRDALAGGFLQTVIDECRRPDVILEDLPDKHLNLLAELVNSVTSEVGRAVVGLTVMQLCIKAIAPEQSIRLHKGGHSYSDTRFSWVEGVPMRSLDKQFITPVLRANDLLRVNADGFMMTRSLAENYPYSRLYKAAIRGAREEWLEIVDLLETGELDAENGLRYMIRLLLNRSTAFNNLANASLKTIHKVIDFHPTSYQIIEFISTFVDNADYSARLLEVAMHSLFQALEDQLLLEGELKPLSQMRSANKKHGNIADVEVTIPGSRLEVIEAWDAKYGKPYLRDELEELNEKLRDHLETQVAGFVVDKAPMLTDDISNRISEIESIHNVKICIMSFGEWAQQLLEQAGDAVDELALQWLIAFTESLCQRRRERAPIDEPSDAWVRNLDAYAMDFFDL
jgi:hypothetical protein